jgi:hypothetical protein
MRRSKPGRKTTTGGTGVEQQLKGRGKEDEMQTMDDTSLWGAVGALISVFRTLYSGGKFGLERTSVGCGEAAEVVEYMR